jgi:hypothetical protein
MNASWKTMTPIVCLLGVAFPSAANAEIAFGESIEWVTADSDRIVVGKVAKVEIVAGHEVVTVDVTKTLRGKHEPTAKFVVRVYLGKRAKGWHEDGLPMVFFLYRYEEGKKRAEDPSLPADAPKLPVGFEWVLRDAVLLGKTKRQWPGTINVFTRDFGLLTEPDAITRHIEAYVKTIPADWKKKNISLDAPSESAVYKKLWSRSAVFLTVPVDRQLEKDGRAWCKDDAVETRVRGAKVLGKFKSDENVKILRALLQDDGFYTGNGLRRYVVRGAAFESLRGLGVEVARPVLEEPLDR